MNDLQKCAEILVDCGYGDKLGFMENGNAEVIQSNLFKHVEPFSDTLEGRRQADAIEDWLWFNENTLYSKSFHVIDEPLIYESLKTQHKWRLDRIKWCILELIE